MNRGKNIFLSMLTSTASKVVTLFQQVFIIPIIITALSAEDYGQFVLLMSYFGWVSMIHGSVNPGLTSVVAASDLERDRHYIAQLFKTTFLTILGAVAIIFTAVILIAGGLADGMDPAFALVGACALFLLPFSQADALLAGVLKQYVVNNFGIVSNLATIGAIILASLLQPTILGFAMAVYGTPFVLKVGFYVYVRRWIFAQVAMRSIRPRLALLRDIWKPSSAFIALQLAVFMNQGLVFISLGAIKGEAFVGETFVMVRLVGLSASVVGMFSTVFWPHIVNANTGAERDWAATAFARAMVAVATFAAAVGAVIAVFGAQIVTLWTGGQVTVPAQDYLPYGLHFFALATSMVAGSFIMGHKYFWYVALCGLAENTLLLSAIWLVGTDISYQTLGWALLGANLATVAWLYPLKIYRISKERSDETAQHLHSDL